MAEVELSRSLGIVLPANNDIIWVARRALAAKTSHSYARCGGDVFSRQYAHVS